MPSVGEQLKEIRSSQRISLADVAAATKIQPWVLEALEADQLQATMSPVYVKSFLIAYAKFLRVDPHPMIVQLLPPPPPEPAESAPSASAEASSAEPSAAAIAFDNAKAWFADALRRLLPLALIGAAATAVVVIKPLRWLPSARVTQASLSAPVKTVAAPSLGETPSAVRTAPLASPAPPLELRVIARGVSWISVRADGNLVAQQQLTPGAKERWLARHRLELVLGNPAQVAVMLNGRPISALAVAHHGRLLITPRGVAPLTANVRQRP